MMSTDKILDFGQRPTSRRAGEEQLTVSLLWRSPRGAKALALMVQSPIGLVEFTVLL